MTKLTRFSQEEIKQIGIRMQAVRVLTGLSREEFADKTSIAAMTIKNWELGRVIPRNEGINNLLAAFREYGVFVSLEWILFGTGAGPNYLQESQNINISNTREYVLKQIQFFKESQRLLKHNPIVVEVTDDSMAPIYQINDILGGILFTEKMVQDFINNKQYMARPWLICMPNGDFAPKWVYLSKDKWFVRSNNSSELTECTSPTLAKIIWHYSPSF
jgi:transcriptional regulator with XRE-family HTH domain